MIKVVIIRYAPGETDKIGAKVVCHGRYITFRLAEVAVPRTLFAEILRPAGRPHQDPLARWPGDVPVFEAARARPISMAVDGRWDGDGHAGASPCSTPSSRPPPPAPSASSCWRLAAASPSRSAASRSQWRPHHVPTALVS